MASRTVTIASASGLHARPAKLFVQEAARLGVPVRIRAGDGKAVPASSMLGVLSLGAVRGTEVTLESDAPGADAALDTLAALLSRDLDDPPPPKGGAAPDGPPPPEETPAPEEGAAPEGGAGLGGGACSGSGAGAIPGTGQGAGLGAGEVVGG
ncbi:HPr family phosphocarrier protein [Nonomuraea sp. NPDC023979]|uniref:HPr family phosphocarrier protein n=1 Tax=Nonomuraea sp. NPDC023979 TaxID=3154796 RepID=UPI00340BD2D3